MPIRRMIHRRRLMSSATFTIANDGRTEHEWLVFQTDLAPANFPIGQDGDSNEEREPIDTDLLHVPLPQRAQPYRPRRLSNKMANRRR